MIMLSIFIEQWQRNVIPLLPLFFLFIDVNMQAKYNGNIHEIQI